MMRDMRSLMQSWPYFSLRSSRASLQRESEQQCGFRRGCTFKRKQSSKNEIRQPSWNCRREHHECGSTTIELVFVLFIIAIIGTAVFSLSSASIRAVDEAKKDIKKAALLLRCDSTLRKHILAIRAPLWSQDIVIAHDEVGISVPYYQAEKDKTLKISHEARTLMVKTDKDTIPISGVAFISATGLLGKAGEPCGLDVQYSIDGTVFHTIARFGATALFKRQ
jgi:hypothetical protein